MFNHTQDVHTRDTIYIMRTKIQRLDLQLIQIEKEAYGSQSPPHQSFSNGYSLFLGAEGNRIEERQMSWRRKPYQACFKKELRLSII